MNQTLRITIYDLQTLRIKVCGITRYEDALLACGLGADALGFIFYEKSPRNISPEKAARIIANLPLQHVAYTGVFANPVIAEVESVLAKVGLHAIQIHGEHDFGLIAHFKKKTKIICAFNVHTEFDYMILESYRNLCDALLLDGFKQGQPGGTGETIDWRAAKQAHKYGRVILAGGLNPQNVQKAVRTAAPYAIDVNSGVEERPGIKNYAKLEKFFKNIKDYRRGWQPAKEAKFPLA
ncbi:MAG: phosphoribosylanthranilate isomerase [bacterium]